MVKIYVNDKPSDVELSHALPLLSEQRRQHVERLRREGDKRLSVAAYLLLCQALRDVYGIEEPPVFGYAPSGKPYIEGRHDIHFNMSHCREAVAIALSDNPVGIDVERIRHISPALCHYVLNTAEYEGVMSSAKPEEAFCRLWTKKESLLKMTGEGLRRPLPPLLDDISPAIVFHTEAHPTFIVTTCEQCR